MKVNILGGAEGRICFPYLLLCCWHAINRASDFKDTSWGSISPDTPSYSIVPLPPHFQMSSLPLIAHAYKCNCKRRLLHMHYHERPCYHLHVFFFTIAHLLKSSKKDISQINALWFLIYLMHTSIISRFNSTWYVTVSKYCILLCWTSRFITRVLETSTPFTIPRE